MSSIPQCYSVGCGLTPVFKCSCDENSFTCQKHCFMHMQGLCGGKLEPFIHFEGRSLPEKSSVPQHRPLEASKKFEIVPMCELITSLFPGEPIVYQCNMCGKLVPKSQSIEHICERNDICILNINYHRISYNKYTCSQCNQIVHTAFLYSHSDIHNKPQHEYINPEDIQKIAALIIQNDSKPSSKSSKLENPDGKQKSKISDVSKSIINSLKQNSTKLTCLSAPLTESKPLPSKRGRHNIGLNSDSD